MTSKLLWITAIFTLATGCAPGVVGDTTGEGSDSGELRHFTDANLERPEVGEVVINHPDAPGTVGICTGTLIGPRTVLTAGHCFEFGSTVSTTELGRFYLQPATGGGRQYVPFHRERVDAGILDVKFDMAIIQLDFAIPSTLATPAQVDALYPEADDTMTVYGYGTFGTDCSGKIDDKKRKWTTGATGLHKYVSCPGDSGGAYFNDRTGKIVALVKGNFLWEVFADPIEHRAWILDQRTASEAGALSVD